MFSTLTKKKKKKEYEEPKEPTALHNATSLLGL